MTRRRRALFAAAALAVAVPGRAAAQFGLFGANKVQYRQFDWRMLHGEHVDLYYYPAEEPLARVALTYAEESYRELEARFRHTITARIPFVVYASHYDFEQTNLLPFTPPEGILGFTEYGRSRVALPFRGNYAQFRHTVRHELVHVFQLSKARLNGRLYPRLRGLYFPLWWSEGSAEYFSDGQDTQDDMINRELTQSGRLPTIEQLNFAGGGAVYAIGGDLVRFLAERYGEWRLVQAHDDAWKYGSFDELLVGIYGKSTAQLTLEWQYALRRRYYPQVETQRPLLLTGRPLASYALKPVVWTPPDDSAAQVLYISSADGYTSVMSRPLKGPPGAGQRTVVQGERTANIESFHAFDSRMDITTAGMLVFATRYMERDAIVFWDVPHRRLAGRYQFPGIVSMLSPVWAPDGRSVVFSGLSEAGESDLYRLYLPDGRLERLTNDRYHDTDPSFSPDGTRLVFASDRTPFGPGGAMNLFVYDIASHDIRYLTYGDWHDEGPRWTARNTITFTSDRRGVQDIYLVDSTGTGRRDSGVPGGAYDPVWVESDSSYVLAAFEGLQFGIFAYKPQATDSLAPDTFSLAAERRLPEWRWAEADDERYARPDTGAYQRRYSVDFAGAEAAITPGVGSAQGASLVLSDMLADHVFQFNVLLFQQGASLKGLVSNFNGAATYINQSRRLNWGVGVFRVRGIFYENTFDRTYRETSTGGFGLLRYPLSRFSRVEARSQLEYSDRTDFSFSENTGAAFPSRHGFLTSNYLTFVHDNSLWVETGPIDGGRERFTGGIATDLANARFDSWVLSGDVRRYLRTSLNTAIALRGYLYLAGGERPQRLTLGGSYGLRGYPRYTYVSGTKAMMVNVEWRFPLTDYLSFGFPFGEWRFPGIQGAVFADIGRAWTPTTTDRGGLGAYGFSMRMNLGFPLVLRLDLGWRYGARGSYQLPGNFRGNRFADLWFGFNY